MLIQNPLCAGSRWFKDGIGPHVVAAMNRLSDHVVENALRRGGKPWNSRNKRLGYWMMSLNSVGNRTGLIRCAY